MNGQARTEHLLQCYAALLETSQVLNRSLEFHELLQYILERLLSVCGAETGSVFLVDENSQFQFIGGRDAQHSILGESEMPLSPAIIARIYASMDVIFVRDVSRDAVLRDDAELASHYVNSIVVLPMLRGDAVLGAVYLSNHDPMVWLDDGDLAALRGMTAQLSIVTDSAIAFSEIARLNETMDYELQNRTVQLTEANNWLAETLRQAEIDLSNQVEMDKARNRFYAALAHELRSPMQLLLGHAFMMVEEGTGHLTSIQRNSVNVILKTCEHVRNLVSKVMDAGKLAEGGMTLDPAPFDIRPMIVESMESARGLLKGKAVGLSYNLPTDLPNVLGDGTRIRQVLLNLLANSCRFTDRGKILVSAMERDGFVIVSVGDTGTGIPEDKINMIFDAYAQADSLHAHTGAGLGLSISKQLVELHGGKLWVKSTVGVGSVFSFSVPVVMS